MSTKLSDFRDELQRRLRVGTGGYALDTTGVCLVAARVQATLAHGLKRILATGTFTAASSNSAFNNSTTTVAAACDTPVAMYASTRSIRCLPSWQHFVQYDPKWYSATGTRSEAFAPLGSNMMIVYPPPPGGVTYSCVYLKDTCATVTTASNFELPDTDICVAYAFSEVIYLTSLRYTAEAVNRLSQLVDDLKPYLQIGGL